MEAEQVLSRIDEEEINWHRQNAYYDRLSHEATIIYEANEKGMKQGLQQGIQQGISQNRIEIAKRMLEDGLPVQKIAEYTNLSVEEIKKLY